MVCSVRSLCGCLTVGLMLVAPVSVLSQSADPSRSAVDANLAAAPKVLFIMQDVVSSFPATGDGVHVGTVRGAINGLSTTNFQFIPDQAPPYFRAEDLTVFVDLDGDQMSFLTKWDGRILTPLKGPVAANNKNRDLMTLVGVFTGSYEVIEGTGKYKGWVGRKFQAKGLAANVARGALQPFGANYTEVYDDTVAVP
jgi:hypothetical protein